MKKEDRKHKEGWKLGPFEARGRAFWLCALCFTFMPLHLLMSLVGIASANSGAGTAPEAVQRSPAVAVDPNSPAQRQLWQAEISVAQSLKDDGSRNELRRMIERIRSVAFEPPGQIAEPVVVPVETQSIKPSETPSDVTAGVEHVPERAAPKPRLPYEPVSEKTLQMLKSLSMEPEKVDNPFELGETLFLSGNLEEAVIFYSEALQRTEPNDVDPSGNRAWMLLQTGNCLRNSDRPAAARMYALLLTEYPNSPWAPMAQTQAQLIDWYLRNEPDKLLGNKEQTGGQ